MKNLVSIFLVALLMAVSACNSKQAAKQKEASVSADTIIKIINVQGMTCAGCESTIEKSVAALPGVFEVRASHIDSMATVTFDASTTNLEAIQEAIAAKGYQALGERMQ